MLKKITASYTLALIGLIVVLGSCKKEYETIQTTDDAKIQQYIKANNLTVTKDTSGFYAQIVTQGTGENFKATDSVLYHISIKSLLNGTTYYTDPVNGNLGALVGYTNNLNGKNILAIRSVLQNLKPGGVARVLLPSYLAFGKNGFTTINVPSNEVIDLTITTMPERKQSALDDRLAREFIAAKAIAGTVKDPSGTYYAITAPGTGTKMINVGSTLVVKYTGRYLNGTVFDTSTDGTASFLLGDRIPGWKKILPKLTEGGKVRMIVPSTQGYGSTSATITQNAILDFDVEVVTVTN